MSLPHEELRSIKKARNLIGTLIWKTRLDYLKLALSKKAYRESADEMCSAIKHHPADYKLDYLYRKQVCLECGDSKQFCKCKNKENK